MRPQPCGRTPASRPDGRTTQPRCTAWPSTPAGPNWSSPGQSYLCMRPKTATQDTGPRPQGPRLYGQLRAGGQVRVGRRHNTVKYGTTKERVPGSPFPVYKSWPTIPPSIGFCTEATSGCGVPRPRHEAQWRKILSAKWSHDGQYRAGMHDGRISIRDKVPSIN